MTRCSNWKMVVDKFLSKLSNWKVATLSVDDQLFLLNSDLGNLSTYYLSTYEILKDVQKNLESLRNSTLYTDIFNTKYVFDMSSDISTIRGQLHQISSIGIKTLHQYSTFELQSSAKH
ncbi:hypothetical protein LXL04_013189 [Taraxacum kok-saghyz]